MHRLVYVESGLLAGPIVIRRLVERLEPSRYDERLAPDRFSLREVCAHLADLEPVIRGRMSLALSSPGADVPNFDPDGEAAAKAYSTWDVGEALKKYSDERAKTVELFRSLSEDQLKKTVRHSILGEVSIYDLAVFILGHDAYHVEQLSAY